MTEAATTSITLSVVNTILAGAGAIDLSTVEAPSGERHCSHWKPLGTLSDDMQRLAFYIEQLGDKLNADKASAQAKRAELSSAADALDRPQTTEERAADRGVIEALEKDLRTQKVAMDLATLMWVNQVTVDFPALAGHEIGFGDNWEVGYVDHGDLPEGLRAKVIVVGGNGNMPEELRELLEGIIGAPIEEPKPAAPVN